MKTFNKIKFLFLLLAIASPFAFVLADTECTNGDCSVGISINVVEGLHVVFNGSVRDLTGGLIDNANVTVLETNLKTVSDAGIYNIVGILSGLYDLTASADGYLNQTKTNQLAVSTITITVDFILAQTGKIEGNAFDFFTSSGINAVNVTLIQYGEILSSTSTDANGYYEFIGLAPGYYDISVEAAGFTSNSKPDNQVLGGQTATVNFWLW